jgi:hypothetical protein
LEEANVGVGLFLYVMSAFSLKPDRSFGTQLRTETSHIVRDQNLRDTVENASAVKRTQLALSTNHTQIT